MRLLTLIHFSHVDDHRGRRPLLPDDQNRIPIGEEMAALVSSSLRYERTQTLIVSAQMYDVDGTAAAVIMKYCFISPY